MLSSLKNFVAKRLGLIVLISILSFISFKTIKPEFSMLGWDNYSSSLDLSINMPRTFFSTWREYRGLGVPSDAEATDIFRQIFYLIAWFIFPQKLLDQVFYIFALWVGVLSMYKFSKLLVEQTFLSKFISTDIRKKDLFATIAALFYLFNLNTLSVFYSPLIPFTNRFYGLPLTLWFILRFINSKKKVRDFIFLALIIIFTSGSYLTPTIIITTLMALFIYLIFQSGLKKAIFYCVVFVLLNSFWIFPFANYVKHRSSMVVLAPAFIEMNEDRLNTTSESYLLKKQSILWPTFFSINFQPIEGEHNPVHPLLHEYVGTKISYLFYLFPVLYSLGSILIILYFRKNRKILWIPIWIFLYLFLSLKEFNPLGFFYILLKDNIPFFAVIFRYADTKFHLYISLAGSIAAAYAVCFIFSLLRNKIVKLLISLGYVSLTVAYVFLFRTYFTGEFMGYIYNKVPKPYFDIAKTINDDPERNRVLHLPMDEAPHYWKSYNWGYIGSAWFNFSINKPYIDKTFEPASMENIYLHKKIFTLVNLFNQSTEQTQQAKIANRFLRLLQQTGVKYILLDQSISANIYPRNIHYNEQEFDKNQKLIKTLLAENKLNLVHSYPIFLTKQYPLYEKLYPVKGTGLPINLPDKSFIELYELRSTQPVFEFIPKVKHLDANLANALATDVDTMINTDYIQTKSNTNQLFPFIQQNHQATVQDSYINIRYPQLNIESADYFIDTTSTDNKSYLIDIYGEVVDEELNLSFYHRYYPDINDQKFERLIDSVSIPLADLEKELMKPVLLLSDWPMHNTDDLLETYRLSVNDVFLPIPADVFNQKTYISSYMLHDEEINVSLLQKKADFSSDLNIPTTTGPSLCYGVELPDYKANIEQINKKTIRITSQNGSYCLVVPFAFMSENGKDDTSKQYVEFELTMNGSIQEEDLVDDNNNKNTFIKEIIKDEILKPVNAYVCIKDKATNKCMNTHRFVRVSENDQTYRVPLAEFLSNNSELFIEIESLPLEQFKQTLLVKNFKQYFYETLSEDIIEFEPQYPQEKINLSKQLNLSFPQAVSNYSYFRNSQSESFDMPLLPCPEDDKHEKIIRSNNGAYFHNIKDCAGMYYAQHFRYKPNNPYLFVFEYWLGSGQLPRIIIGKSGHEYLNERVSLNQGYPDIPNFRQFQDKKLGDTLETVKKRFNTNVSFIDGSRLLKPQYAVITQEEDVAAHILQYTLNDGIMGIDSFNIMELPADWYQLKLTPIQTETQYTIPGKDLSFNKIFPSLWQVNITGDLTQQAYKGKSLLFFNEGYDQQWGIYENWWQMLFGKKVGKTYKCNGFANCFELDWQQNDFTGTFYVFYWPEVLYVVGWGATLSTIGIVILILFKKSRRKLKK